MRDLWKYSGRPGDRARAHSNLTQHGGVEFLDGFLTLFFKKLGFQP